MKTSGGEPDTETTEKYYYNKSDVFSGIVSTTVDVTNIEVNGKHEHAHDCM